MDEDIPGEAGTDTREAVTRLRELVRGVRVAMMVTLDVSGKLHSRPMATLEVDDDGSVWFLSGAHTNKVDDVHKDQRVHLTYVDPSTGRYVAVTGRAETVDDRSRIRTLWSPVYRAWFPKGPEDTELTLVRVKVEEVEAWERPAGTFGAAIGALRALTGARGEAGGHEHHVLRVVAEVPSRTTSRTDVRPAGEKLAAVAGRAAEKAVSAMPSAVRDTVNRAKPSQERAAVSARPMNVPAGRADSTVSATDTRRAPRATTAKAPTATEPSVTRPARTEAPKPAKKGRTKTKG